MLFPQDIILLPQRNEFALTEVILLPDQGGKYISGFIHLVGTSYCLMGTVNLCD